jgi:putative FmdB family regulatory protein
MPVYTYQCENCSTVLDAHQKFSDGPLVTCPECGQDQLHRVYKPVGIVFKGSGFYATDNRSPSGQKTANKDDNGTSEKSTDSSTSEPSKKTEPKTEKKASSTDK